MGAVGILHSLSLQMGISKPVLMAGETMTTLGWMCPAPARSQPKPLPVASPGSIGGWDVCVGLWPVRAHALA